MKLVRFGELGREKPGILDDQGIIRDASSIVADYTPEAIGDGLLGHLKGAEIASLPAVADGTRLGAPIARTGHFIGIGLNYADHAEEANLPIPAEPIVFSKAANCLSGPYDDVILPEGSDKTDWEVELAFVIGRRCHKVSQADALDHVFGYAICNDVSERSHQMERGGQWMKGKSAPTFGPLGPWLVTADEISDPQSLPMFLDVNGVRAQTGNSATMIFTVAHIISYLSQFMVLDPGDVVTTGTPPGVGMGMKPQKFLRHGDEMILGIDGLGEQRQKVVAG
jgi:2-keto-4-pentenoate hydratase/2-oxohepta-3-ene-1,7-dioic acid hydratase in catechol pathway